MIDIIKNFWPAFMVLSAIFGMSGSWFLLRSRVRESERRIALLFKIIYNSGGVMAIMTREECNGTRDSCVVEIGKVFVDLRKELEANRVQRERLEDKINHQYTDISVKIASIISALREKVDNIHI